jgi:hypothetical protein
MFGPRLNQAGHLLSKLYGYPGLGLPTNLQTIGEQRTLIEF